MENGNHHKWLILIVGSFHFILIPMLWVYDHYKYFNSFSAEIVFIRQNMMYKDCPRTERVNVGELSVTLVQHLFDIG